jgi:isoleucyl-tRNA synthetase
MDAVFERLTVWLAPLLPFTTEEAWTTRFPDNGSVCARVFPDTPAEWRNDAEAERWAKVQSVLSVVTTQLEFARRDKVIGAALEAAVVVHGLPEDLKTAFDGLEPADIFRTSAGEFGLDDQPVPAGFAGQSGDRLPGVWVHVERASGLKCARSWKVLFEVQRNLDQHGLQLTDRDLDAVRWLDAHPAREQAA